MYIGALALKKESIGLLRAWLQAYKNRRLTMGSGEQNSLMVALQHNPIYRFFPLPYVFNFRYSNILPRYGPRHPIVIQSSGAFEDSYEGIARDDIGGEVNYKVIGKQVAVMMMGDTVERVKQRCTPFAFDCSVLTLE